MSAILHSQAQMAQRDREPRLEAEDIAPGLVMVITTQPKFAYLAAAVVSGAFTRAPPQTAGAGRAAQGLRCRYPCCARRAKSAMGTPIRSMCTAMLSPIHNGSFEPGPAADSGTTT